MFKTPLLFTLSLTACVVGSGDDASAPQCSGGKCDYGGDQDLEIAKDLAEHCTSNEVVRIARPVDSDHPDGDTFAFGFRFKAPTAVGAPVLVYLPGGPGQSSMDSPPMFVPDGWGYLMTDPRGVGCNRLGELPSKDVSGEFFSTKEITNDVLAAITDRKLSNYIVFGISYGSALGTTVAHEIEARGLKRPIAVVLEGVLGRQFAPQMPGDEYTTQWHRVRDVLPPDVLTELDTEDKPYGFDATAWSTILMNTLPRGPGDTYNMIAALSTSQPGEVRQEILDGFQAMADAPPSPANEDELYRQVACREIMDTVPDSGLDVVFAAGDLVRNRAEEGSKCRELHVVTPYDSAKLPFSTPLYLFIGDSDTATPAWQGNYHYDHHAGPVTRVTTRNGGHNSLELNQADCAPALMAAIAAGGSGLSTAADSCPMATTIDRK
jgi:pimeloyl-ACP methyl ester carboxylesterase